MHHSVPATKFTLNYDEEQGRTQAATAPYPIPESAQEEKQLPPVPPVPCGWSKYRRRFRQPLAEFLGMFVLMLVGLSCSIVNMTSDHQFGTYVTTNLGWGLGVMLGIYVAGGISGAHLNPVISVTLTVYRGVPWQLTVQCILAQFLACFGAAGTVFGLYKNAITQNNTPLSAETTGIAFYCQPATFTSGYSAFFTEFVATAILSGCVLAMLDSKNAAPGAGMSALTIGLLVTSLCMAFAYNTGCCLNPVRDLGPRLMTALVGYGSEVWTSSNWWWVWGPWGACMSGGLIGALIYDLVIFEGDESPVNYSRTRWMEAWGEIAGPFKWRASKGEPQRLMSVVSVSSSSSSSSDEESGTFV